MLLPVHVIKVTWIAQNILPQMFAPAALIIYCQIMPTYLKAPIITVAITMLKASLLCNGCLQACHGELIILSRLTWLLIQKSHRPVMDGELHKVVLLIW